MDCWIDTVGPYQVEVVPVEMEVSIALSFSGFSGLIDMREFLEFRKRSHNPYEEVPYRGAENGFFNFWDRPLTNEEKSAAWKIWAERAEATLSSFRKKYAVVGYRIFKTSPYTDYSFVPVKSGAVKTRIKTRNGLPYADIWHVVERGKLFGVFSEKQEWLADNIPSVVRQQGNIDVCRCE